MFFFVWMERFFNRLKICIFSAAITPWGVELWNQFPWNQFHIYPADFKSMGCQLWNQFHWNQFHIYLDFSCETSFIEIIFIPIGFQVHGMLECWIAKPVSLKSISYLSSGFQVHGVSTVKPISLKSISYLFGFQLWDQFHWNHLHIYWISSPWNVGMLNCETSFIKIHFISIGFQVHGMLHVELWNSFIEINFTPISIGFQVHGAFKCATFF